MITNTTFTQKTRVCVHHETKRSLSFAKANDTVFVPKLIKVTFTLFLWMRGHKALCVVARAFARHTQMLKELKQDLFQGCSIELY